MNLLNPQDLGDGLILRQGTPADADAVARFNGLIHSDFGPDTSDEYVVVWTQDLFKGDHPTTGPQDFTIVENTRTGEIVSSLVLISQTWTYGGIPVGVGRPELVGTLPAYRQRGLVRRQFEIAHEWSRQRGEHLQAITGIPYYYRQFGYEMALDLGGCRVGSPAPSLPEGQTEPVLFRPATVEDIPFIQTVYARRASRYLLDGQIDADWWRYMLTGMAEGSVNRLAIEIIATSDGQTLGFIGTPPLLWGERMGLGMYELADGASWMDLSPAVVRHVSAIGQQLAAKDSKTLTGVQFNLGREHPAYAFVRQMLPVAWPPYAYFMRVTDLAAFLRHIAPVLERRLAASDSAGFSGDLKLSFYRTGLALRFAAGRLEGVEPWRETKYTDEPAAAFPGLTFYQLLFGYRTLAELRHAFVDLMVYQDRLLPLIEALFPQENSAVYALS